jgi:outer membrane lipase/esterase
MHCKDLARSTQYCITVNGVIESGVKAGPGVLPASATHRRELEIMSYSIGSPSAMSLRSSIRRALLAASGALLVPGATWALTPAGQALVNSAQTTNQGSMASSVANVCPQMSTLNATQRLSEAEQQLFYRCREILNSTPDSSSTKPEVLEQLTSDELTAGQRAAVNQVTAQRASIASRLLVLRRSGGAAVASNELDDPDWRDSRGGAAGDDATFADGRIGVYLNGSIGTGDKDQTADEAGYDIDTQSATAGMDYRISDSFVAGAALSYGSSEVEYLAGGGYDSDGISGALYASFYGERAYLNLLASYGQYDHDLARRISYSVACGAGCLNQSTGSATVDVEANGSTSSDVMSFGADFGYMLSDGPFTFTPMASISWVQVDLDGFSERNAGAHNELALAYDEQTATSLEVQFGITAAYAWSQSWGVLSPYARLMAAQEMRNSRQVFGAHYVFDPCFDNPSICTNPATDPTATGIRIQSDRPDSAYYRWAAGVSAVLANGFSAFAEYETLEDYRTVSFSTASVGVRYQFR